MSRKFWFGKYKGDLIIEICKSRPSYIGWCLKNVRGFKLNEEEKSFYSPSKIARPSYPYDNEGTIWEEFNDEMTFDMINNFD